MNQGALRRGAVVLVAIAACLGIAACGSSSNNSSGSGSGSSTTASTTATTSTIAGNLQARRAALASCLKAHGVTLPTNGRFGPGGGRPPGAGTNPTGVPGRGLFGGGGNGGAGGAGGPGSPGGFLSNPRTRAAFQACAPQFGRGFGNGRFRRAQLSHTAINNFVACVRKNGFNMPAPNFSGTGGVFPANIRTNPKFVSAAKACASILVPPRPAGGTAQGTSTT
jgi:hypothetical protein